MAVVQRYVNTASTPGGDGTTNATVGATRAYASLSEWEAAAGGSATDDYIVDCCGTAADTTPVTVDFATNITTGSILIRGNRSDSAGFYTGNAAISSNHYRLTDSTTSTLILTEAGITVDGIQIENGAGAARAGIELQASTSSTGATIRNCRIRNTGTTRNGIGSVGTPMSTSGTYLFENNLIVGFNTSGIEYRPDTFYTPSVTIRENTIYGNGSSVGITISEAGSNTGASYTIKGNAIGNSGASNCFSVSTSGGGTATYDDNATEDAQGTTGEIPIGTLANAWTSPGTTAAADFSVKDTSSSLYNAVNPTLVTTDITGFTRDGTNHDVGAFELQAGGGPPPPPSAVIPRSSMKIWNYA